MNKEESSPRMPEYSFLEGKGNKKLNIFLFPRPTPPQ